MAQMASVFAELERAMTRERTKSAMHVKRSRGERISRNARYGWHFTTDQRLIENPREQEVIAFIRQLRAEGRSLRAVADLLNEKEIKPKCGTRWIHTAVQSVLRRQPGVATGAA